MIDKLDYQGLTRMVSLILAVNNVYKEALQEIGGLAAPKIQQTPKELALQTLAFANQVGLSNPDTLITRLRVHHDSDPRNMMTPEEMDVERTEAAALLELQRIQLEQVAMRLRFAMQQPESMQLFELVDLAIARLSRASH